MDLSSDPPDTGWMGCSHLLMTVNASQCTASDPLEEYADFHMEVGSDLAALVCRIGTRSQSTFHIAHSISQFESPTYSIRAVLLATVQRVLLDINRARAQSLSHRSDASALQTHPRLAKTSCVSAHSYEISEFEDSRGEFVPAFDTRSSSRMFLIQQLSGVTM